MGQWHVVPKVRRIALLPWGNCSWYCPSVTWPLGQWHVIPWCNDIHLGQWHLMPCFGQLTCDDVGQYVIHIGAWNEMPKGNIMWCLGTIAADTVRGASGQWHVMPWGNQGSWYHGAMPGDSAVGWFFRDLWFGVQSAQWLKKTITWKKVHLNWGTLKCYVYHHEGFHFRFDFVLFYYLRTNGPFFYHSYLGNDEKNNWNWDFIFLTFHYK